MLPELGKIRRKFFDEVIYPRLGAEDSSVLMGPQHGVDFGVIEIGENVLVHSTDPVFIMPSLGWDKAAWFALHILASDVAVSGIPPRFLSIDLNLPPEMDEATLKTVWSTLDSEAKKLGIAIISGHTARYAGCNFPMVGGATILGLGKKEKLIDPRNMQPGDKIIITKGPAVETTGLMATQFGDFLERAFDAVFVDRARSIFYQMTVVQDAAVAAATGGVTAMHDATEYGLWGGLYEMVVSQGLGLRVEKDRIPIQADVEKCCEFFDIDPFAAISEGTLIIACKPDYTTKVLQALEDASILAAEIGEILPADAGKILVDNGRERNLEHPQIDPFWAKFEEYLRR
ncbi:MAG: AIR synthase family protein [bacterium]